MRRVIVLFMLVAMLVGAIVTFAIIAPNICLGFGCNQVYLAPGAEVEGDVNQGVSSEKKVLIDTSINTSGEGGETAVSFPCEVPFLDTDICGYWYPYGDDLYWRPHVYKWSGTPGVSYADYYVTNKAGNKTPLNVIFGKDGNWLAIDPDGFTYYYEDCQSEYGAFADDISFTDTLERLVSTCEPVKFLKD